MASGSSTDGVTDEGELILKPRYNIRALRHAAESIFIEQGMTPKRVQTVMGHATIMMTMETHGHLFPDPKGDHEAMAQIQARLLG